MLSVKKEKENVVLSKYYVLSEHWKSDFDFFRDECQFLSSILNKYFVYILQDRALAEIQKLAERLSTATKTREEITKSIIDYMADIKSSITLENESQINEIELAHARLERSIADFVKTFKALKRDVFLIAEEILQSEKVKKLLSA